jgi:hypothetical protein
VTVSTTVLVCVVLGVGKLRSSWSECIKPFVLQLSSTKVGDIAKISITVGSLGTRCSVSPAFKMSQNKKSIKKAHLIPITISKVVWLVVAKYAWNPVIPPTLKIKNPAKTNPITK